MQVQLADRMPIVDTDSHVTEPPDLWTSRLGRRWADELIPHTRLDERKGEDRWHVGGKRLTGVASFAVAGWSEFPPSHPLQLEQADPAAWNPDERLKRLDEYGIYAQVLYPNLLGFYSQVFHEQISDHDLLYEVVQAYNDFLTEFSSTDVNRFVPIMALPFWDLESSTQEIQRCFERGHKGILFSNAPEKMGLPRLRDPHWAPIWEKAQELGLSINFHVGFMATADDMTDIMRRLGSGQRADYAKESALAMISNATAIAEVALSGMCHRYPRLNFVSVESGFGWLPFWLEVLDWQWLNSGAADERPDMEMPSFYLRRQVYGSFWFEREALRRLIDLMPDNVMFESDFPHPTSLSPGPASYAKSPRETVEDSLVGLPEELIRKVLYENATKVYHLELPTVASFNETRGRVS